MAEDGRDDAQNIWRHMKFRKYGSGWTGSFGQVKFSTDINGNGGARGGGTGSSSGSKTLVSIEMLEFPPSLVI